MFCKSSKIWLPVFFTWQGSVAGDRMEGNAGGPDERKSRDLRSRSDDKSIGVLLLRGTGVLFLSLTNVPG